jgi:hypothetical protein
MLICSAAFSIISAACHATPPLWALVYLPHCGGHPIRRARVLEALGQLLLMADCIWPMQCSEGVMGMLERQEGFVAVLWSLTLKSPRLVFETVWRHLQGSLSSGIPLRSISRVVIPARNV